MVELPVSQHCCWGCFIHDITYPWKITAFERQEYAVEGLLSLRCVSLHWLPLPLAAMDISADLTELSRTPVAVVCAGAKSILDIGRTLEVLVSNQEGHMHTAV